MKKVLFWVTYPVLGIVSIVFLLLELLADWVVEGTHKWEAWCFDYAKKHPDMEYRGGGIWVSKNWPK